MLISQSQSQQHMAGLSGGVMLCGASESSDGKKKKSNPQFVKSDCLVSIEIMVSWLLWLTFLCVNVG